MRSTRPAPLRPLSYRGETAPASATTSAITQPEGASSLARRQRGPGHTTRPLLRGRSLGRRVGLAVAMLLLATVVAGSVWIGLRLREANQIYQQTSDQIVALERLSDIEPTRVTVSEIERIEADLMLLNGRLARIQELTTIPWISDEHAERLPWIGDRYRAARLLLRIGSLLTEVGTEASRVGRETLIAFQTTGATGPTGSGEATWFDVIVRERSTLESIAGSLDQARTLRAELDGTVLPTNVQVRLNQLDEILARDELDTFVERQLPAAEAALGADAPARYLLLFQNPAELRPSGGFPGTIALVTLERGQLVDYQFFDIYDLNADYVANRTDPLPQPWPLDQFVHLDELPIQDATWWADFPRSGAILMRMYEQTGWPSIHGVVAVEPAAVADLLEVTGPLPIDVEGETRIVDTDNVYDEIERQRRLHREGKRPDEIHKEVLALIGEQMLERLKGADRATIRDVADAVSAAANRRSLQVYIPEPAIQSILEGRHWTGRLIPDSNRPTLAVTFANIAFGKSSLLLDTNLILTIAGEDGPTLPVKLEIRLTNTGAEGGDELYSGFQRWWTEVTLPEGSQVVSASLPPSPDPDAPNGGSYEIGLEPGESRSLVIEFSLPHASTLLVRRQPGLAAAEVEVVRPDCDAPAHHIIERDTLIDLGPGCP